MITIHIEDRDGVTQELEVPEDINLSLMELLKAAEYDILATCGGMALCATCHIQIIEGWNHLEEASDTEMDMLDTLPDARSDSRLACQIRIRESLDGLKIRILG